MNADIQKIVEAGRYNRDDCIALLRCSDPDEVEYIRAQAEAAALSYIGRTVYYRGLIEFSNICARNCYYCGIRMDNKAVQRYQLTEDEIVTAARWCAENRYGSLVLQSGERSDAPFVDFVEHVVRRIKKETRSTILPDGLGVTLCVGEQSRESYQRFFDAGAHRYLLRIETTSPELFSRIHPPQQSLETRRACLKTLRDVGFQVGTGVMIGIPGQTITMLADDLQFFRELDIDMFGMGPWLAHEQAPMGSGGEPRWTTETIFRTSLLMLSLTRLMLKDVNIAATTALQTIDPIGREKGIRHGANVIMPQLTPTEYRRSYMLYEGKPCVDEERGDCKRCLENRISITDREIGYDQWGDPRHFFTRSGVTHG